MVCNSGRIKTNDQHTIFLLVVDNILMELHSTMLQVRILCFVLSQSNELHLRSHYGIFANWMPRINQESLLKDSYESFQAKVSLLFHNQWCKDCFWIILRPPANIISSNQANHTYCCKVLEKLYLLHMSYNKMPTASLSRIYLLACQVDHFKLILQGQAQQNLSIFIQELPKMELHLHRIFCWTDLDGIKVECRFHWNLIY